MFHLCFCFFVFFKRKHSPHRVHSDLLTRQFWNSFIFMLRITWLVRTLKKQSKVGWKRKSRLTESCAPCELIDGRLWHAVRQHARELDRKTRRNLGICLTPCRGPMITNALDMIQNLQSGAEGWWLKKKQQKTPLTRVKVRGKKTWDRRQESTRANSSVFNSHETLCFIVQRSKYEDECGRRNCTSLKTTGPWRWAFTARLKLN